MRKNFQYQHIDTVCNLKDKFRLLCLLFLFVAFGSGSSFGQTTLNPTADTDVQSDVTAGTNTTLNASQWCTMFSKFSLSSFSGTVTSAKLRIYQNAGASGTLYVNYATPDSWTEGGTKPAAGSAISSTGLAATAGYVEIDITGAVNTCIAGDKIISLGMTTSIGGWTNFNSRENTSNKPQLVITTSGVPVTGVSVSPTTASLNVLATTTLTATVTPSNATIKTVSWSSSNAAVATVNTSGVVTAVSAGSATITVTTQDQGKTATCAVTVTNPGGTTTLNPTADTDSQSDVAAGTNAILNASLYCTMFSKFSLSGISGTVTSAKLRIYQAQSASGTLNVNYASPDSWVEGGSKPTAGSAIASTSLSAAVGYVEIDVTGAVNTEVAGDKLISFAITTSIGGWTNYNARESASNKPQLVITTSGGGNVTVTGVSVSPTSASLTINATTTLTATVAPSNATNKTVNWSSSNTNVATVNSSGVVTGVSAGSASITATTQDQGKTATCAITVTGTGGSSNMRIGTNFWEICWGPVTDYYVSGTINWATVTNPWNTTLLSDLSSYNGPIRFMDFGDTNNNTIVNWSARTQKTSDNSNTCFVAYEWMIDLCNRTNHDMWVCVPTQANADYWTQLATLIKNNLNASLKCYVEYSNETWNGGFIQNQYTINQGIAGGLPGDNQWYQGGAFSVYRSLQIFKAFQDVFGSSAMGSRVMRVVSWSGNMDIADKAFANVLNSSTWNPNSQKVDMGAVAPYIGPNDDAGSGLLDGNSANIATRFRANVDWNYTNYMLPAKAIANKYGFPLGCYEGGQQMNTNAGTWSSNQAIYNEYKYMFDKLNSVGLVMFNHYTHLGVYVAGQAWGAKSDINQTLATSPKFRAITDWVSANAAPARSKGIIGVDTKEENVSNSLFYPNPASGSINLRLKGNETALVSIIDFSGKQVIQSQISGAVNLIDVQNLNTGIYLVRVNQSGITSTGKLLIQR